MKEKNQRTLFELIPQGKEGLSHRTKDSQREALKIHLIDLELIKPNPFEPRKIKQESSLQELVASIRRHGLLCPVLVRREQNGTFTTLAGARRIEAHRRLGRGKIPALVVEGDPLEIGLIENLLREDLAPLDEAEALKELKEKRNYTLEQLSDVVRKSPSYISEIISLATLPDEIKESLRTSEVQPTRNFLIELAREKDPKKLMKLWRSFRSRKTSTVKSLREKRGKSGSTLTYKAEDYTLMVKFRAKEITKSQLLKAINEGRRNLLKRIQERE